jgi:hypothetical protein
VAVNGCREKLSSRTWGSRRSKFSTVIGAFQARLLWTLRCQCWGWQMPVHTYLRIILKPSNIFCCQSFTWIVEQELAPWLLWTTTQWMYQTLIGRLTMPPTCCHLLLKRSVSRGHCWPFALAPPALTYLLAMKALMLQHFLTTCLGDLCFTSLADRLTRTGNCLRYTPQ